MDYAPCLNELRERWFPHVTDAGLHRLIELLASGSPLLMHGAFTGAIPMGCLATHVAWNHPATCEFSLEAGVQWLHRVAGLNPATSLVIRAWDEGGLHDWELRSRLLEACKAEQTLRQLVTQATNATEPELMLVA